MTKNIFQLAIASDYEYDGDFIDLIEKKAHQLELSTYIIWPQNFTETLHKLQSDEIRFEYLLDRASDTSAYFLELQNWLHQNGVNIFDSWEKLQWASDKAVMHMEFKKYNIHTPYTIIIHPYSTNSYIDISTDQLTKLGKPFIIKPANTTGAGTGVIDRAETLQDVMNARMKYKTDKYLLQEKISPLEIDNRRYWFRCFYCCNDIICAWWNDITHIYNILTTQEIEMYNLSHLLEIVKKIADICMLRFFSTEIAYSTEEDLVVIDYVNEVCDMRIQSKHIDGVPDSVVEHIAKRIAVFVKEFLTFNYKEK